MVNPFQLASMLIDWMDPEKTVYAPLSHAFERSLTLSTTGKCPAVRRTTVFMLISPRTSSEPCLMTILPVRKATLYPCFIYISVTSFPTGESKKFLCQLLTKLHLPEAVDENKIKTLKLLIYNVQSVRE